MGRIIASGAMLLGFYPHLGHELVRCPIAFALLRLSSSIVLAQDAVE